ncbi:hypothetical protein VTO73DRAFT_15292 [Trametes versicolor]
MPHLLSVSLAHRSNGPRWPRLSILSIPVSRSVGFHSHAQPRRREVVLWTRSASSFLRLHQSTDPPIRRLRDRAPGVR